MAGGDTSPNLGQAVIKGMDSSVQSPAMKQQQPAATRPTSRVGILIMTVMIWAGAFELAGVMIKVAYPSWQAYPWMSLLLGWRP